MDVQSQIQLHDGPEVTQASSARPWSQFLQHLLQFAGIIVLAALCYLLISQFLLQGVLVVGSSMAPTLRDADRYLLNRWVYWVRDPRPGEIVVIRDPVDKGHSVKRVIARAGDNVEIDSKGLIHINGVVPEEPYLDKLTPTFPAGRAQRQSFTLAEHQYFVLGDNRLNSADSRVYGPVNRRDVLGLLIH